MGPVVVEGGRFLMPIPFTEMIWDRDLRPQGGAVALQYVPKTSASRFALHGIYATGSHVYEDESVMYGGGLDLTFAAGQESSLQLVGSYLQFEDLDKLEPQIRRQNTRVAGLYVHDYHVVDLIARIRRGGQVPLELVANYAWNTAVDQDGHGLWLAAMLGNVGTSRASLAYTYAKVDKDATVAAFNTDDFFWGTGWEGHRLDLATGTVKSSSIHGIAQRQRFKDSPDPDVADSGSRAIGWSGGRPSSLSFRGLRRRVPRIRSSAPADADSSSPADKAPRNDRRAAYFAGAGAGFAFGWRASSSS